MKLIIFFLVVAVHGTPPPMLQRLQVFSACVKKSLTEEQAASGLPMSEETKRCLNEKVAEFLREGGNIANAIRESIALIRNANVGQRYLTNHINELQNHVARLVGTPNPDIMLTDRYQEEQQKLRQDAVPGLARYFADGMLPTAPPTLDLEFVSIQLFFFANQGQFDSLAESLRMYELIGVPRENIQYVFYKAWKFLKKNEIPQMNENDLKHAFQKHIKHATTQPTAAAIEKQLRPFFRRLRGERVPRLDELARDLERDIADGNLERVQYVLDACIYLQVPRKNIVALFAGVYESLTDPASYFD